MNCILPLFLSFIERRKTQDEEKEKFHKKVIIEKGFLSMEKEKPQEHINKHHSSSMMMTQRANEKKG